VADGAPRRPSPGDLPGALTGPAALVAALILVDSLHYVFTRLLTPYLPPPAAGFYVMAVSTLEVAALQRGRPNWAVLRRHAGFFVAIGVLVAGGTALGYAAMRRIDPGAASLLSRTAVLFGVGLGVLWLGDRLRRLEVVGALAALGGVAAVSFQPGDYTRSGSLMVVTGTFLYTLHAALVKRHGTQTAFLDFFLFRLLATTAFLLLFSLPLGGLPWPDAPVWGLIAVQATVDTVISRALYYLALRRLDMSLHTLIQTLSPVATVGWSFLLWGAVPGAAQAVGGLAILAGIGLITASRTGVLRW
jgi:drug/metabolite transporter (DMT)-like permease